jgi:hypothetical protein
MYEGLDWGGLGCLFGVLWAAGIIIVYEIARFLTISLITFILQ